MFKSAFYWSFLTVFAGQVILHFSLVKANGCQEERVLLKGGVFTMGHAHAGFRDTLPEHKVQLSAFEISRFETTISDYLKFNPKPFPDRPILFNQFLKNDPCLPMHYVSWKQAKEYCLSNNGRLPTEAEWEYAASVGVIKDLSKNFWPLKESFPEIYENPILMNVDDEVEEIPIIDEDDHKNKEINSTNNNEEEEDDFQSLMEMDLDDEASEGSSRAQYRDLVPVDTTYMGANGLQGMSGNVWEWVNDWYAPYIADEQINPTGPKNGFWKVLRGGSYQNLNHPQKSGFPILLSPRFRNHAHPDDQKAHLGFRCVWDKMD